MMDTFEIIVGTYEQYLLGYKVNINGTEYKLEKSFATHSHVASIRSVDSNKHYLASAGADDVVCLYDMQNRIESGKLMHHSSTVNCIAFTTEGSHLFTCSNDGSIAAIRCGNWQIEKHWQKAHKGLSVNTIAIHPTGKIALSVGMDGVLKTWNLVKGRQAYAINLVPRLKFEAKNIMIVKWSPNGERYLLAINQRIDVYSVELAGIDKEIVFDTKIVCVEFLTNDLIAIGFENGQIKFYDLKTTMQTIEVTAHNVRVKCMAHRNNLLVSASSSGEIKLWEYNEHNLNMLQTVNCDARITCLSLASSCKNSVEQREIMPEEEKKVKPKSKIRLKQEVIIENEGEWESTYNVTNVIEDMKDDSKRIKRKLKNMQSVAEKSTKKKRNTSPAVQDNIDKPRKKKKLSKTNDTILPNNKRNDRAVSQSVLSEKKSKKRKQKRYIGKKAK